MKFAAVSHIARAFLAPSAVLERDTRERHYPDLVKAGKITREDAEGDIAAWRAIAEMLEHGETQRQTSWTELHLYTSRCVQNLELKVKEAQASGSDNLRRLIERRDLVAAIHERVDHNKYLADDLTEELRRRTATARLVA